jgi:hypothetical protein
MRALAMTGIVTVAMISLIIFGSDILATPPWALMSAGTRSRAMTATAPASSAIRAYGFIRRYIQLSTDVSKTHLFRIHDIHDDTSL